MAGGEEEGEEFLFWHHSLVHRRRIEGQRVRVYALEFGAEKGHNRQRGGLVEDGEVGG